MKVKKHLKIIAKQNQKNLMTKEDYQFLDRLKSEIDSNSVMSKKKLSVKALRMGIVSLTIALIFVFGIILFYPTHENKIEYLESNFERSESTIEEMNGDLTVFSVKVDETKFSIDITKISDSVSGDTLYYSVRIASVDLIISVDLVIVTNPNYQYTSFPDTSSFSLFTGYEYSILYQTELQRNTELDLDVLEGIAKIQKKNECVYVLNYSEFIIDGNDKFIETIQEIIK